MRNYKKFSNEELVVLEKSFKQCSFYPTRDRIRKLARALKTQCSKIDNWFKYKRRKMYYSGKFSQYKIRKIFAKGENEELNTIFEKTQKPNFQRCKEIAEKLDGVTAYQIKNWFSNRRRKLRNDLKKKVSRSLIRKAGLSKQGRVPERQRVMTATVPQAQEPATDRKLDEKIKSVKEELQNETEPMVPCQRVKVEAAEEKKEPNVSSNQITNWPLSQPLRYAGPRLCWPNTEMINLARFLIRSRNFN